MEPIDDNTSESVPETPQQKACPTTRRIIVREAFVSACAVAASILCVLFAIKLAPPVRAQGTPTPTPTCTATPTITPTPPCEPSVFGPCPTSPCPASPYPTGSPPLATPIPDEFQPQDENGERTAVVLQWRVYEPTSGGPKWPAAIILHEGHFATGSPFSGLLLQPALDLQKAGYYTLVADFPLAPCGLIQGQTCHDDPTSGRPPQQTNAVKAIIRAARSDPHCNGKVVVIGGSGGASHAAFVAFDTTVTNVWPFWNSTGDDRPDAIVCLSGAYDFPDRTPEHYGGPDPLPGFMEIIESYTNTCVRIDPNGGPSQWTVSPLYMLHQPTSDRPFRPALFINSEHDTMPYHQIVDMQCALENLSIDPALYRIITIPGDNEHAFAYWDTPDGQPGNATVLIAGDVLSFLDGHLP